MRLRREEADAVLGLITERSISKQASEFPEKGPQTFESRPLSPRKGTADL